MPVLGQNGHGLLDLGILKLGQSQECFDNWAKFLHTDCDTMIFGWAADLTLHLLLLNGPSVRFKNHICIDLKIIFSKIS